MHYQRICVSVIGTPLLAQEALAGLASKENFSKVSLRKAESFHGTGLGDRHLPHKEIMLLLVKGQFITSKSSGIEAEAIVCI